MSAVGDIQKRLKFGLNTEQEDRFRQANFGRDIAQARIFVILVLLPFVALLVNDYGFFGLSQTFYGLLVLRLAFAAYTIQFLKNLKGFTNYRSYDRAEFFWGLFLAIANTAINTTRPENFVAHTIVTVLAVFVLVLAIPNRFTNQLILALVYTFGQTLIIVPSLRVSPQASFVVLLSMLTTNAIAITSSWLLHFWRRREFLVHEEIQKAKVDIEMQLAERKKAEEALRESKALLFAFLEQLPVGTGLFDPQGRWLISNSLLSDLVSGSIPSRDSENSWRWRTWRTDGHLIPQSEWPGARALKGENVTPGLDFLYTFDDGKEMWTRVTAVPFHNDVGEITGVITVIQDIDKQKQAEEALKRSEKGLAEAQRIAHLGNWDRNLATGKLYWSDELYRIFGLKPQEFEITYNIFLDYVHPEDRDYVDKAVKKALNGGSFDINYRIVSANGEERVVHSQSEVVFNEKNNPVRIRGITQDITEHIRAEEKIQRLADIVESSDDSIFSLSLEGIITSWNRGAEQVYGYSAEEILGKNVSILEPENLKGEIKKLIERVKNNEKVRYYETLRLKKDGTLINVSITFSPVFNSSGKLVAVSTIARDITERKQEEHRIRRYNCILEGINLIFGSVVRAETEEELGNECLSVALEVTGSQIGFVGEVGADGLLHDIAISDMGWSQCLMYDKTGHRRPPGDFILHGLYGCVIDTGKSFFTNDPQSHPNSIGLPQGHPALTSFLGVPLILDGKTVGTIAVANREGGYSSEQQEDLEAIAPAVTQALQRKKSEEALAKIDIVRQKEIHHRIKNNLQVISSLLDLTAERFNNRECIKDSEVLKAFRESQDRVASMALIHEELYKGGGFETLNFSPYIKELAENLFQTYQLMDTDISLNMDLKENIFFNMDIGVPLGIIINELVSNSLKHAFIGRDTGEIRIKLYREEKSGCINGVDNNKEDCKSTDFVLAVSDNGIGIPENLDIEDLDSLGLQLVVSLVDQLDGELELNRENGTEFIIKFTVTE